MVPWACSARPTASPEIGIFNEAFTRLASRDAPFFYKNQDAI
jgi:hypothetical protein